MHYARKADVGQCVPQVVGAVVMKSFGTQLLVAVAVAGGDQRVMHAGRFVFHHGQNHAPLVGVKAVTHLRSDFAEHAARVLHGHAFAQVRVVKSPKVHDLGAMGIDNP